MEDIHLAQLSLSVCEHGHIHLKMTSVCDCGVECPALGATFDVDQARLLATDLLEAANRVSPVS